MHIYSFPSHFSWLESYKVKDVEAEFMFLPLFYVPKNNICNENGSTRKAGKTNIREKLWLQFDISTVQTLRKNDVQTQLIVHRLNIDLTGEDLSVDIVFKGPFIPLKISATQLLPAFICSDGWTFLHIRVYLLDNFSSSSS